jgi:hypothetical protein
MKLKKINEKLREGLRKRITEANTYRKKLFCFKSGADCVIISPKGSGNPTIVINVIQQLVLRENNRPAL